MRAQVSLEYLLVFTVSLTAFLIVLPFFSRVNGISRNALDRDRLDLMVKRVSAACEELLSSGGDRRAVEGILNFSVSIEGETIHLSKGDLNASGEWSDSCRVNSTHVSKGERLMINCGV